WCSASTQDPTIIFFRWDFDGDGIWDTPWLAVLSLSHSSSDIGVMRVTVQGWDGVSTSNGEPLGPVAVKNLVLGGTLEFGPRAWNRSSTRWLSMVWEYPSGFQGPAGPPGRTMVYASMGS